MSQNASQSIPTHLQSISTPALILERDKLNANIQRIKSIAAQHNVDLRTHMKTSKSAEIACALIDEIHPGIAVSTLKEAVYFANAGVQNILYAVSIDPRKFAQLSWFYEQGVNLQIILDSTEVAQQLAQWAAQAQCKVNCLIEIDTDGHRAGIKPDSAGLISLAQELHDAQFIHFCGVMTHGGGSYDCLSYDDIKAHADLERSGCVAAAQQIRDAGIPVDMVSIGSTPTVMAAKHFTGATEIRPGVYVFFDLFQHGLGVCELSDIALSVLTTVIGHSRDEGRIFLDAGGLALSKDHSTASQQRDFGYGLVCDEHGQPLSATGEVVVSSVYQEHGVITVSDPHLFEQLPIGTLLRVLPNHACMTAAAHDHYFVADQSEITALWHRCNGW